MTKVKPSFGREPSNIDMQLEISDSERLIYLILLVLFGWFDVYSSFRLIYEVTYSCQARLMNFTYDFTFYLFSLLSTIAALTSLVYNVFVSYSLCKLYSTRTRSKMEIDKKQPGFALRGVELIKGDGNRARTLKIIFQDLIHFVLGYLVTLFSLFAPSPNLIIKSAISGISIADPLSKLLLVRVKKNILRTVGFGMILCTTVFYAAVLPSLLKAGMNPVVSVAMYDSYITEIDHQCFKFSRENLNMLNFNETIHTSNNMLRSLDPYPDKLMPLTTFGFAGMEFMFANMHFQSVATNRNYKDPLQTDIDRKYPKLSVCNLTTSVDLKSILVTQGIRYSDANNTWISLKEYLAGASVGTTSLMLYSSYQDDLNEYYVRANVTITQLSICAE